MITIYTNQNHCFDEKQYILHTIFSDFWGLAYEVKHHDHLRTDIVIFERTISFPDIFFYLSSKNWLNNHSLPNTPCPVWTCRQHNFSSKLVNSELPILFGQSQAKDDFLSIEESNIFLHFDILGACFYMLSGYEEFVSQDKDRHDRFPHTASHSYVNQYLERPLVNEYLEVLWFCLQQVSPGLTKKQRKYQVRLSHDVDIPFRYAFSGWKNVFKEMVKSLKDLSLIRTFSQPHNYLSVKYYNKAEKDPYYTFPFLMDIAEQYDTKLWFYFLVENTNPENANYDIQHPFLKKLLWDIHTRGHYIGLHGSYQTYCQQTMLAEELDQLKRACFDIGIKQKLWGNRQHFLRWHNSKTVSALSHSGITHDTTVGFPGYSGFKSGTCYDYFLYDLALRKMTAVREYPLIVMEATLLGYMQLGHESAFEKIRSFAQCCRKFQGNFTLLWHNSNLSSPGLINLYSKILASITFSDNLDVRGLDVEKVGDLW